MIGTMLTATRFRHEMKFPLTIIFSTARPEPKIEWFFDSLKRQCGSADIRIVVVDFFADERKIETGLFPIKHVGPKPNVWQGKHRLTKGPQWWAVSNSRNTGLCLTETPWIAVVDDRAVLSPNWCEAVSDAMEGCYIVAGAYEKRIDVMVENGLVTFSNEKLCPMNGTPNGKDTRLDYVTKHLIPTPFDCPGEWFYGCSSAAPLEWLLRIGGWDETCDGLSMEDVCAGLMISNNGFPIKYDPRMMLIEDRTTGSLGPAMKREDKGKSPNDKSHALLNMLKDRKTAMHGFDIRAVRRDVLAGKGWPAPWGPTTDFYDGQKLEDMT